MTRHAPAHPGFARGVAAAFAATLLWGGQLPIAKGAFVALDGYSMTVVRYVVAGAAFALLLWWQEGRGDRRGVADGEQPDAAAGRRRGIGLSPVRADQDTGFRVRRPSNREKSRSVVTQSQPDSIAIAAR